MPVILTEAPKGHSRRTPVLAFRPHHVPKAVIVSSPERDQWIGQIGGTPYYPSHTMPKWTPSCRVPRSCAPSAHERDAPTPPHPSGAAAPSTCRSRCGLRACWADSGLHPPAATRCPCHAARGQTPPHVPAWIRGTTAGSAASRRWRSLPRRNHRDRLDTPHTIEDGTRG